MCVGGTILDSDGVFSCWVGSSHCAHYTLPPIPGTMAYTLEMVSRNQLVDSQL